jgi:hypothetical protein
MFWSLVSVFIDKPRRLFTEYNISFLSYREAGSSYLEYSSWKLQVPFSDTRVENEKMVAVAYHVRTSTNN